MTDRRRAWLLAAAPLVFLTTLGGAGGAGAAPPPTQPAPDEGVPASGEPVGVVQSWTLTPGGSQDGNRADGRPNLSYQLAPGTSAQDTVIVYNLGNVPMDLRIYATDAFNNDSGDFDLLPGDDVPVDAGAWVTLAQESIVLPPGKQATIPITVSVPVDATPGDHVGAIVASSIATADNGDGQVVKVDRRTGTRLYVQVSGPLTHDLAVTNVSTDYDAAIDPLGGSAAVSFRIENRGNVRASGTPVVEVSGPFGIGKRSVTLDKFVDLLPGEDMRLETTVADLGAWVIDSTTVRVVPADTTIGEVAVGRDRTFAPPVTVFILAILAVLAWITRRAYARHRGGRRGDPGMEVLAPGERPYERELEMQ